MVLVTLKSDMNGSLPNFVTSVSMLIYCTNSAISINTIMVYLYLALSSCDVCALLI